MKTYIPNRVHFRFTRKHNDGMFHSGGHRTEVWKWLTDQIGPEDEGWTWMPTPMIIDHQEYDGFFLFEDENNALMFKMMFR